MTLTRTVLDVVDVDVLVLVEVLVIVVYASSRHRGRVDITGIEKRIGDRSGKR